MPEFLTGNKLNTEIESILEKAETLLVLISPYIKLHERYIATLKSKLDNPKLQLIIVFGKNEDDISKSMKEEDFKFFVSFPNVKIYYEKNLHAKYIANEVSSIITSMNFHKFSLDNNIEVGVKTETGSFIASKFKTGDRGFDMDAWDYFQKVINQATQVFNKEPKYDSQLLGLIKKYTGSVIKTDNLTEIFKDKPQKSPLQEISRESNITYGYCIRTGIKIPFNINKPYSLEAYKEWSKHPDKSFKENFCHFTGEPTNGETSFSKPILWKNFKKAKESAKF